nr:hypothetical protein [Tanacetum cinerariifolium]
MSFSKRQGNDVVCYTKPLDSLKGWNDHFLVDAFAFPAFFLWHTSKSVLRDVVPKSSEFNAEHYATLVAYPAPFHKNRFALFYLDCQSYEAKASKKRKTIVTGAGEPSCPPKKLREDHGTLITKDKTVEPSLFSAGSTSGGGTDPAMGCFVDLSGSDFHIGGIRTVISPDTDLQKACVPQLSVTNRSCLDDSHVCRKIVDEFSPLKFFASVRGMKHDQLFTEFNVGAEAEAAKAIRLRAEASNFEVIEKSLQGEVEALKERNNILKKEKSRLDLKVADLAASVKVREQEVADLDVVVTSVKLQNDNLADQFLKKLNDDYESVRSQILAMNPLPTVNKAYYIVQQIEKQKQVTNHSNKGENSGIKDNRRSRHDGKNDGKRFYTGCNQEGHTVDQCFEKNSADTPFDMGYENEMGGGVDEILVAAVCQKMMNMFKGKGGDNSVSRDHASTSHA